MTRGARRDWFGYCRLDWPCARVPLLFLAEHPRNQTTRHTRVIRAHRIKEAFRRSWQSEKKLFSERSGRCAEPESLGRTQQFVTRVLSSWGLWHKQRNQARSTDLLPSLEQGLSGRALRKLPFLAHAAHVGGEQCTCRSFISALHTAISSELADREEMGGRSQGT